MDSQFIWTATRPERSCLRTKPSAYSRLSKYKKTLPESTLQPLCWEWQRKTLCTLIVGNIQAASSSARRRGCAWWLSDFILLLVLQLFSSDFELRLSIIGSFLRPLLVTRIKVETVDTFTSHLLWPYTCSDTLCWMVQRYREELLLNGPKSGLHLAGRCTALPAALPDLLPAHTDTGTMSLLHI